jgi:pimeloyl-ACP methyl ester carboxylesterase
MGVAKIVLVHGAFNELWGPNELKARWLPALRDGLWHHAVDIHEDDVDVCFYGDLFRRMPGTDGEERLEKSRAGIAESLTEMAGGDALAIIGEAANDAVFERTVDLVTIMFTEPDLRKRLRDRIEATVDGDTRVIVAHSLGTVLTYMALCHHPNWSVHTFVTLGSPLASPMIFDTLDPAPVDGQGVWPGSIERWVNVRAVGDKACLVALSEKFGPRVEEILVDNGHRAHAPEPYLNAIMTGSVVADALA